MPTECSPALFDFAPAEGRRVVATFDGGTITSNAGALCCSARRTARLTWTAGLPRASATRGCPSGSSTTSPPWSASASSAFALGHEDVVDHDRLRHDPVGAGRARRQARSPATRLRAAGWQVDVDRLEHAPAGEPGRYHRIGNDAGAIEGLFVDVFLDAHRKVPPRQIILDLDATGVPLHGHQEGRFFHGYSDAYCYLPLSVFCGRHLLAAKLRRADIDATSLYERVYCARGKMENRIKECQLDLFAGRASAASLRANQLRLWFASMAHLLLCAPRRIGLAHTQFATATCGTLRLAPLKIAAQVRRSVHRVAIAMASAMASGHPFQDELALAHARITAAAI